ncbi:hypothetical protein [uncultured Ferrovibrio sp.]|jgi:hypothetical protein|uniref:hypothetical protein n=1 Tax=uncultured Ferrovibrio sp. TaxID=1576913 RepID=UPI002631EFD5|nr:hypothetical protein [uncultured Ferrovibrio sp.]
MRRVVGRIGHPANRIVAVMPREVGKISSKHGECCWIAPEKPNNTTERRIDKKKSRKL